jgi:hypothetical protein
MLIENVRHAYVHDVVTVMNCRGLVLKGTNSVVDGVYSRGHGIDSVIVESDDYAPTSQDELTNVTIEPLIAPGDTKGIIVKAVHWSPIQYQHFQCDYPESTVMGGLRPRRKLNDTRNCSEFL